MRDAFPETERRAALSVLVLGVGSPFGDDRAGWEVVAAVDAASPCAPGWPEVRTLACDRPGAALIAALQGVQHAVIVDLALDSAEPAGTLRWLSADELEVAQPASSHGFGVAQALALARALGLAPPRIDVLAIAGVRFEGEQMSAEVRAAVSEAAREVLARLRSAYVSAPAAPLREPAAPDSLRPGAL